MKPVSPRSYALLNAAMARLVAGRSRVTDGRLTVTNLAREAGVGRSTANRAVDVIEAFHAATRRAPPRPTREAVEAGRPHDAAEIAALRATVNKLAQQVQRLALHGDEQRRTIESLRAALAAATAGRVVPFRAADPLLPSVHVAQLSANITQDGPGGGQE